MGNLAVMIPKCFAFSMVARFSRCLSTIVPPITYVLEASKCSNVVVVSLVDTLSCLFYTSYLTVKWLGRG